MRVDLVAPYYRPARGGIEDHVAALAAHAQRRGHDIVVHALARDPHGRPLPASETMDGVRVRRWRSVARFGYYTTLFEPDLEGDLIHLHAYGPWTHDWIARTYRGRAKILTLHHGLVVPTRNPVNRAYHWLHRRTRGRGTLDAMDAVIAVTRLDVERLAALGYPADRIQLIPNGVPESAFQPATPWPPRGAWNSYFLYLGRLHREKSVDHALEAIARLPPRVGFVVAGWDQGDLDRLRSLVDRLGLLERVEFVPTVDEERKRSLVRGARALVLPSAYEAQGRVILEAWAQGVPVVASRVGGVPYFVEHGIDGLLFNHGDVAALEEHLRRLADDPALARRLGEAGREKAHRDFQEATHFDRVLATYEAVAARRATTRQD